MEYLQEKKQLREDYISISKNNIPDHYFKKYKVPTEIFEQPIIFNKLNSTYINIIYNYYKKLIESKDLDKYKPLLINLNPLFSQLTPSNFNSLFVHLKNYMDFIEYIKKKILYDYASAHKKSIPHLPPIESLISRNTAYLFVELHGSIKYQGNTLLPYTVNDLEIFRVMQSTFGAINLCDATLSKRIFDSINVHSNIKDTPANNRKLIKATLKKMMPESKCVLSDIRKSIKSPTNQKRKTFKDKCLKIHTKHFIEGDQMADKILSMDLTENNGFDKILLIGNEVVNLLDYLPLHFESGHFIYSMKEIIETMRAYANMIVIIDLSCSTSSIHNFNKVHNNVAAIEKASFKSANFETSPILDYTTEELKELALRYFTLYKNKLLSDRPDLKEKADEVEMNYLENMPQFEIVKEIGKYNPIYFKKLNELKIETS